MTTFSPMLFDLLYGDIPFIYENHATACSSSHCYAWIGSICFNSLPCTCDGRERIKECSSSTAPLNLRHCIFKCSVGWGTIRNACPNLHGLSMHMQLSQFLELSIIKLHVCFNLHSSCTVYVYDTLPYLFVATQV